MASEDEFEGERASKRVRTESSVTASKRLTSLHRDVSPPPTRSPSRPIPTRNIRPTSHASDNGVKSVPLQEPSPSPSRTNIIPSPIHLTHITSLPSTHNISTTTLSDFLSSPLISQIWHFNFMFDIDFTMSHLDADIRNLVAVTIVHGSWKAESPNRMVIEEGAKRWANVKVLRAWMSEVFGTHHCKMSLVFRRDDVVQIAIYTANMIPKDWTNMTQAIWLSPLLPLIQKDEAVSRGKETLEYGNGAKFKLDLLNYLSAYGESKTGTLVEELRRYDFSAVKAALVASVPGRQNIEGVIKLDETTWGWVGLREALRARQKARTKSQAQNMNRNQKKTKPRVVTQVSSIATLGRTSSWLTSTFASAFTSPLTLTSPTSNTSPPSLSVIFPTPEEVRTSLDGYASGGSIHTKTVTPTQSAQVEWLKPMLCHWKGRDRGHSEREEDGLFEGKALRGPAAPHIKTYIQFSDGDEVMPKGIRSNGHTNQAGVEDSQREDITLPPPPKIDWALITSANLSTQAWGATPPAKGADRGTTRISSYEIGVLVWPEMWDEGKGSEMVPVFGRDDSDMEAEREEEVQYSGANESGKVRVCLRMPYDLPLSRYEHGDEPWCQDVPNLEPDWMGRIWPGGDG